MKKIEASDLFVEIQRVFGSWLGTPSEELLEDGGIVIDHLSDVGQAYGRDELEAVEESTWQDAWNLFYEWNESGQVGVALEEVAVSKEGQ